MFRRVYDNLVAGGRFITYTDNPEFTLSKPNCTKYGVTLLRQEPEEDQYACEAEFLPLILHSASGGTSGTKPRMSGRSRRPDSGTSLGTPRRWRRRTSRAMGRRIGMISWIIARSSGWSARSNAAPALDSRGCPRRAGEPPDARRAGQAVGCSKLAIGALMRRASIRSERWSRSGCSCRRATRAISSRSQRRSIHLRMRCVTVHVALPHPYDLASGINL